MSEKLHAMQQMEKFQEIWSTQPKNVLFGIKVGEWIDFYGEEAMYVHKVFDKGITKIGGDQHLMHRELFATGIPYHEFFRFKEEVKKMGKVLKVLWQPKVGGEWEFCPDDVNPFMKQD